MKPKNSQVDFPFLIGFVHVRESQIQGVFNDIQGHVSANSRTKYWKEGVRISNIWRWIVQNGVTLMNFEQLCQIWTCKMNSTKCPYWMSNNFRKYPLKQEEFKDFQVLLYKFKDIQGLEFLFSNSRTFTDFPVLYALCFKNLLKRNDQRATTV
jgi:hypothetical protein